MKKKVINTVICDVRGVKEEVLKEYETILINTTLLITGDSAEELLNRYHVKVNTVDVMKVPDGEDIKLRVNNGMSEIGKSDDGANTILMVNGTLVIGDGSKEAAKSYYKIVVNGTVQMPESLKGQLQNLFTNGENEYYPDGATLVDSGKNIDSLFVERAENNLYYCSGELFFLDAKLDTSKIIAKDLRFMAEKVIIAESLLDKLVSRFNEKAEIVCVPDGTCKIDEDIELNLRTIRKYGTKLCVRGDVRIEDAKALASLEYLFADGKVTVNQELEETLDQKQIVYKKLVVLDADTVTVSDKPKFKLSADMLKKYPKGVRIEDCAIVVLAKDLSCEDIMAKLHIVDCALVYCTKEQEEAVSMIAEDVAMIKNSDEEKENQNIDNPEKSDTQLINAVKYTM